VRFEEINDRGRTALADGLTEIEGVELPPHAVVGEAVRVLANLDLEQKLLVGAAEDTDAGGFAIAGE
jgi:hypothetical protein